MAEDAPRKRARKQSCNRYAKLVDSFATAVHSILTACPQQDLLAHFAFEKQQQICSFYTEVAAALHSGVKDEFEAICTETKVKDFLKELEARASRAAACALVEEGKCPSILVAMDAAQAKETEVQELRRVLLEEEEQKSQLTARRDDLRSEVEDLERAPPPTWMVDLGSSRLIDPSNSI